MGFFSDLFGGDSDSGNSTTTNKTDNIDQKLQMATGSVGGTASGNGVVNIHTSDMGAIDDAFKFANASSDSSFKFADSALDHVGVITNGALNFAAGTSDSAFKVVNATVDSSMKLLEASNKTNAAAITAANANAMNLANAATDSAFRFGDSTVSKAFDFTSAITQGAAHDVAAAGARADGITQDALAAVRNAYAGTSATLADAYTNSKAGEQKVMVAAALAILAIVAVKVMGK